MPLSGDEASGRSPWHAFSTGNDPLLGTGADRGRLFSNAVTQGGKAWYPLSGRRNYSSGCPLSGTGYCYASTTVSSKAYYLGVYTDHINTWAGAGLNGRAEAFPVRCIRE